MVQNEQDSISKAKEPEQMPEIKPEIVFIFELVRDVEAGKIRIPNFQRKFVWRRDQMTDLLDSIRRQFPIGSLLAWETETTLGSKEWVGPVRVPLAPQGMAAYVLDGQQRLSTLVGTMRKPKAGDVFPESEEDPARWDIRYNTKEDGFEHAKNGQAMAVYHLPMWSLMDTIGFLNECQRMLKEGGEDGPTYVERAQAIARSFQAYKMPVTRIRNTNLSKAVEIFARLNTKGQSITADQMVAAMTYTEDDKGNKSFNLDKIIDQMIEQADAQSFGDMARTVVLRACLAALGEDIYNTDWTRMQEDKRQALVSNFPAIMEGVSEAIKSSLDFLSGIGIKANRLLPYAMQVVILTAFFHKKPVPSKEQRKFLRRWLWASSFTGFFASGNPSRVASLIKEFRDEITEQQAPEMLNNMNMQEPAQPFPKIFDMRSARTRCLLNVMLSLRPCNAEGEEIPDPWRTIHEHGPNALGKIFTSVKDKVLDASPANRIYRIDMNDRKQGKTWLQGLSAMDEAKRANILLSHGIPPNSFDNLLKNRADAFLSQRLDYLMKLDQDFIKREGVVPPTSQEPQNAPIDTE